MTSTRRATTPQSLDTIRRNEFATWLHKRVLTDRACNPNIRKLGLMPQKRAMCYEGYDVNGFRFHTEAHSKYRSTVNSGVCVKGECTDDTHHDYYGILKEVVELEYDGVDNKVVLFNCHWFDITNGVKVDHHHGLVEVKHTSTLQGGEPFVLACQTTQVYYLPYASNRRERSQWWIAMKTKRKGNPNVEDVEANPDFFQEEQPEYSISITVGQDLDWDNVLVQEHEFEQVDPADLSNNTSRAGDSNAPEDQEYDRHDHDDDREPYISDASEEADW